MLSRIKRFAQQRQCHVWLVAHPRALQDYSGGAPTLYDISGSAHFVNKADAAVVVHRPNNVMAQARRGGAAADAPPGTADPVQVLVRKMRNKAAGKIGDVWLAYDRVTGRYEAVQASE
jgi:twinkle protein